MTRCPFLLKSVAGRLPGGVETMMFLAWLSEDPGTRAVAKRWVALARKQKEDIEIEEICRAAGLEYGIFFSEIASTGFELGIIVPLAFPIGAVTGFIGEAIRSVRVREEYWKAVALMDPAEPAVAPLERPAVTLNHDQRSHRGASRRLCQGERVHSADDYETCSRFAETRQRWRLSQAQFAELFMTTRRTIRRWEEHQFCPAPTQDWFLE
jgi:DNA-binding transcriptional regulator YiaG